MGGTALSCNFYLWIGKQADRQAEQHKDGHTDVQTAKAAATNFTERQTIDKHQEDRHATQVESMREL